MARNHHNWTRATEKTPYGTRYVAYNQNTGAMHNMGIGSKGKERWAKFVNAPVKSKALHKKLK